MTKNKSNIETEKVTILDKNNKKIKSIDKKKRKKRKWKSLLFFFIWVYFLISVFITDLGTLMVLNYKITNINTYIIFRLLFIVLLLLSTWILIGNKRFWKNVGLFFLFPIYPGLWIIFKNFGWKLPKFLLVHKWHLLLYYYIELAISFFVKFKFILFRIALFILGFFSLFKLKKLWLLIPMIIFASLQMFHLVRRFKEAFSSLKIFKMSIGDLDEFTKDPKSTEKLDELISDSADVKDSTEEEKTLKEMEQYLIVNEFANAFNFKLKDIINRRIYMLSFLSKALFSFFIAIVYFGAINYGLYHINPNLYLSPINPKYFDFFYYSFFTIFPNGTDIIPIGISAKIIRMAGVTVGVIINLLLLAVYLTISNERFKENLSKLSTITDNYTKGIQSHFEKKYGCNPTDGLKKMKNMGSKIDSTITILKEALKI